MKNKIFAILFMALSMVSCDDDFLEKPPLDDFADATYWTSENNIRTYSYGLYPAFFTGYGVGFTWGNYFSGQVLNDDVGPTTPSIFTRVTPPSNSAWTFSYVRRANIMLDRVQNMPDGTIPEAAKNHWMGVARFFRGLEYHDLVKAFGDVPYFEAEVGSTDFAQLYKPRDSRTFVMDKVLADLTYAANNVKVDDGTKGLTINKFVVLAFMSRVFLFEGTWQKYHANNTAKAKEYLEAAKWAADQVIASGRYSVATDYRNVFSSLDLSSNPEVILFRQYTPAILTHSLMSYSNKEGQTGANKDVIDSYLAADGLPISISPVYQGDKGKTATGQLNVMTNRDPRINATFAPELRPQGATSNAPYGYSTTGYAQHKFLSKDPAVVESEGVGQINSTDAPVIRYGEVLVNYAEAVVELATVGGPAVAQEDLDKSINKLRDRPGIRLPHLQVKGGLPAVGDQVYDDPERDPSVPSLIWEIRRERRIELIFEGFRLNDLKRWKKFEYLDTQTNSDINRGAWLRKSDYPGIAASVVLTEGAEGYIIPAVNAAAQRTFVPGSIDERLYLSPLGLDQINLYKEAGYELAQNPGWE